MKITFVSLTLLSLLSVSCGEKTAPVLAPSDSGLSADVGGDDTGNSAPPLMNGGAGVVPMPGVTPTPGAVPGTTPVNDPAAAAVVTTPQATTPGTDPGSLGEGSLGGGNSSADLTGNTLGGDSLGGGGGLSGDGSLSGLGGFGGGDSGGGSGPGMGGFG